MPHPNYILVLLQVIAGCCETMSLWLDRPPESESRHQIVLNRHGASCVIPPAMWHVASEQSSSGSRWVKPRDTAARRPLWRCKKMSPSLRDVRQRQSIVTRTGETYSHFHRGKREMVNLLLLWRKRSITLGSKLELALYKVNNGRQGENMVQAIRIKYHSLFSRLGT